MTVKDIATKSGLTEDIIIGTVMEAIRSSRKFIKEQAEMVKNENAYLETNIANYRLNQEWGKIQREIAQSKVKPKVVKRLWNAIKLR